MKSMNIWNIENSFYLNSKVSRLNKVLCQFELFKKTIILRGDIVECGVFKGSSLIRLLTFRDLLTKKIKKKVIGFDSFGKFPNQIIKEDKKFAKSHDKTSGYGIKKNILETALRKKKFNNFELIKGDVFKTIPEYLRKNTKLRISFLHLDMDVFEPTKLVLNLLYSKIVKNGVILIDDYNYVNGATKATKEFLSIHKKLKIEKLKFNTRLSFIIKK
jgi:hypothetical protein